jgi:hypothetical protein
MRRRLNPLVLLAALVSITSLTLLGLAAFGAVDVVSAFRGKQVSLAEIKKGDVVLVRARTPAQRFAVLSRRHSNQCSLTPERLETIAVRGRLQGSCCRAMVFAHYVRQLRGLARYQQLPEIPSDPYDISVSQAKRLITWQSSITLTPGQQRIYDKATSLADEHGPCCCHCWRWTAFEGQAKELIVERRFAAAEIAAIWDLEDGCGGGA